MAILETLAQISQTIGNMVETRADKNLNNLSEVGMAKLGGGAGIPWTTMSNVLTSVTNLQMTTNSTTDTSSNVTFSGTVNALIPNGKEAGTCSSITASITLQANPIEVSHESSFPKAVMVDQAGAVSIVNYVVSYTEPPSPTSGDMWYNLGTNILSFYENGWTNYSGVKIGSLKVDDSNNLIFMSTGAVRIPDFDTMLSEIELAKAPTGTVIAYMGTEEPEGYLLMDGRELSRTTYSNLFSVIGTTQGEGDGSTTFNIADMTDGRYLMGSTVAGGSELPVFGNGKSLAFTDGLTSGASFGGVCAGNYEGTTWKKICFGRAPGEDSPSGGMFGKACTWGVPTKTQLTPDIYHYTGLVAEFSPNMLSARLYLKY